MDTAWEVQLIERITKTGHQAMKPRLPFSGVDSLRMDRRSFSGLNALYGSHMKPCTATVSYRLLSRVWTRSRPEDRIRATSLSGKCRRIGSSWKQLEQEPARRIGSSWSTGQIESRA